MILAPTILTKGCRGCFLYSSFVTVGELTFVKQKLQCGGFLMVFKLLPAGNENVFI